MLNQFTAAWILITLLGTMTSPSAIASEQGDQIRSDILSRSKSSNFSSLIAKWEKKYGSLAAADLFAIASDQKLRDTDRFIAFMGASKLTAQADVKTLQPFLKDPSWLLRSAALRTLGGFHQKQAGLAVLELLHDPAQVVQSEAIDTVLKLKPAGAEKALVQMSTRSCTSETPDWICKKTLDALIVLRLGQNPES